MRYISKTLAFGGRIEDFLTDVKEVLRGDNFGIENVELKIRNRISELRASITGDPFGNAS